MTPNGGGAPTGKLADLINSTWGSFDAFKAKFNEEAANHFGSGWAWLVRDGDNKVRPPQSMQLQFAASNEKKKRESHFLRAISTGPSDPPDCRLHV